MSTIRPEITDRGNLDEVALTPEELEARGPPKLCAFTIPTFCQARQISAPLYYKLRKLGLGPVEMRLGHKILISVESAVAWRRAREVEAIATTVAAV